MKILLDYDPSTGKLSDKNGVNPINYSGLVGYDFDSGSKIVLDLVKQGVSPEDIIKLKNADLLKGIDDD